MATLSDDFFEFNSVPKFVELTKVTDFLDPAVERFFKRTSSGIQADFDHNDAENIPPQAEKRVFQIELVPEDQIEKAKEVPVLDKTMNHEDEARIIEGISNELMKLSMFGAQPKRLRRSEIEQQERKAAAAAGHNYDLRPRTPGRSLRETAMKKPTPSRARYTTPKLPPRPPTPRSGSVGTARGRSVEPPSQPPRSRSISATTARPPSVERHVPVAKPRITRAMSEKPKPVQRAPIIRTSLKMTVPVSKPIAQHTNARLSSKAGTTSTVNAKSSQSTSTTTPKRSTAAVGAARATSDRPAMSWVDRLYQPKMTPAVLKARESRLSQKSAAPTLRTSAAAVKPTTAAPIKTAKAPIKTVTAAPSRPVAAPRIGARRPIGQVSANPVTTSKAPAK